MGGLRDLSIAPFLQMEFIWVEGSLDAVNGRGRVKNIGSMDGARRKRDEKAEGSRSFHLLLTESTLGEDSILERFTSSQAQAMSSLVTNL